MGDPRSTTTVPVVGTEEHDVARRPWPRSLAIAGFAALTGFSLGLIAVALPLFGLARALELLRGVDRPFIRDNLTHLVLPVSLASALVSGVVVGRWYRRGGQLPGNE
ncbi:MAG: hypothetical protein QOE35_2834 [Actinomycetota bacterium]|jgi:hypothetical protein